MNYIKSNPVGIDKPIERLKGLIYDGLGYTDIDAFGRSYVIEKNQKNIPVHYVDASTSDYEEILFNDEVNGHFFFLDKDETTPLGGSYETEVEIIFFFNVKNLKPNISHRADEEIRSEVINVIERYKFFEIKNILKGPDVLKGFDTDLKDIQPRFFFKITGILKYQINC